MPEGFLAKASGVETPLMEKPGHNASPCPKRSRKSPASIFHGLLRPYKAAWKDIFSGGKWLF